MWTSEALRVNGEVISRQLDSLLSYSPQLGKGTPADLKRSDSFRNSFKVVRHPALIGLVKSPIDEGIIGGVNASLTCLTRMSLRKLFYGVVEAMIIPLLIPSVMQSR